MKKLPKLHINEQVNAHNQQKVFTSNKFESPKEPKSEINANDYLLNRKIKYAVDNKSKNVIIKFKDSNITTDILGKSNTQLQTKNGDIELASIVNIYL